MTISEALERREQTKRRVIVMLDEIATFIKKEFDLCVKVCEPERMFKLNQHSIEALRHKADVATDTYDANDPETAEWLRVAVDCGHAAAKGTVEALRASKAAQDELDNYLNTGMPDKERRAIVRDLCRAGHFPVTNPNVVQWPRRIKTTTVDGVRYDTGE